MKFENKNQPTGNSTTGLPYLNSPLSPEVKRKIRDFEQGDINSLNHPDIIAIIAQHIYDIYKKGDMKQALILLENLGEWSRSDKIEHRERSLMVLSLITEKVLHEDSEDFLEAMSRLLIIWLKYETEYLAGFEFICHQLQEMVQRMLHRGLWNQSEDFIVILNKIKKGVIKKNKIFTQVIARLHGSLADKEFLGKLTETYINDQNERRDLAAALLVHFADKSALHLLITLSNCPHKEERLKLIEILPATGSDAIPPIVGLLRRKPPWYVVRNIILILSKLADPSLFHIVRPFMSHRDTRVQQEVIDCAKRMNGNHMVERLLDALETCNDKFKPELVRLLGQFEEEKIGTAFLDLLRNPPVLEHHLRDEIIKEICNNLNGFPSHEAVEVLQDFLTQKGQRSGISDDTISSAENTFHQLQQKIGSLETGEVSESHNRQRTTDPNSQPATTQDSSIKDNWKTLLQADDWLAQTIEDKKTPASLRRHLVLRNDLYQEFQEYEFSAFLSFLSFKTYKSGETLVERGDVQSNLYFIDSGKVNLVSHEETSKFYIHELQEGDVFGNDVFMSGSEWNLTLTANSDTEVYIFDQEQLLSMQLRFPELAIKILDYGRQHDVISGLLRMTEKNQLLQRTDEPVLFRDSYGDSIANIELIDISTVGLSFSLHLPEGFDHTLFADKMLSVYFRSDSDKKKTVIGRIVARQTFKFDNSKLRIFTRFMQQVELDAFICTKIDLQ